MKQADGLPGVTGQRYLDGGGNLNDGLKEISESGHCPVEGLLAALTAKTVGKCILCYFAFITKILKRDAL